MEICAQICQDGLQQLRSPMERGIRHVCKHEPVVYEVGDRRLGSGHSDERCGPLNHRRDGVKAKFRGDVAKGVGQVSVELRFRQLVHEQVQGILEDHLLTKSFFLVDRKNLRVSPALCDQGHYLCRLERAVHQSWVPTVGIRRVWFVEREVTNQTKFV